MCDPRNPIDKPDAGTPGRNFSANWRKTPGRVIGIGLIRLYQLTLSGFIGNACRHQPTCSEYGYEAIARHGLLGGSWLTLFRVAKCNPLGTSGYDPVPPVMRWASVFEKKKQTD